MKASSQTPIVTPNRTVKALGKRNFRGALVGGSADELVAGGEVLMWVAMAALLSCGRCCVASTEPATSPAVTGREARVRGTFGSAVPRQNWRGWEPPRERTRHAAARGFRGGPAPTGDPAPAR